MNDKNFICPVDFTLGIIGGKWKMLIIWHLMNNGMLRYGQIKKSMIKITHKMLSQQLKELEADGIINRNEFLEIPPRVEYSLTEKGATLISVLRSMVDWGNQNMR